MTKEQIAHIESIKPTLTNNQNKLLSAFYSLSNDRDTEQGQPQPIKGKDIYAYQDRKGSHGYPDDLFETAINSIDQKYIEIKSTKKG